MPGKSRQVHHILMKIQGLTIGTKLRMSATGTVLYVANEFAKLGTDPCYMFLQLYRASHMSETCVRTSVADPDPYVFWPPGSGSISQRYGSGSFNNKPKM
jgi:hypothetical protein